MSETIDALVERLARELVARHEMLATAESCTGGGIAAACTDRAGSSAWFERGFVTYSNEAKSELLDVPAAAIDLHGAVSEPVALAMAEGALHRSKADWSVAVTGVAGPAGGTATKPVGTVWIAVAGRVDAAVTSRAAMHRFPGDRRAVRLASVVESLSMLLAGVETGLRVDAAPLVSGPTPAGGHRGD